MIDWEYPALSNNPTNFGNAGNAISAEDGPNMVKLLKELREGLDKNNMKNYPVRIAIASAPEKLFKEITQASKYVD